MEQAPYKTAFICRNVIIILAVLALPFLVFSFVVGDAMDHMMFRPYADVLKDATEPPYRVRMTLFLAVVYIPVAMLAAIFHWAGKPFSPAQPSAERAALMDARTTPSSRPGRLRRFHGMSKWAILCAIVVSGIWWLGETSEEREKRQERPKQIEVEVQPSPNAVLAPSGLLLARQFRAHHADRDGIELEVKDRDDKSDAGMEYSWLLSV